MNLLTNGCGKLGHIGQSTDEGTQCCLTCEIEALRRMIARLKRDLERQQRARGSAHNKMVLAQTENAAILAGYELAQAFVAKYPDDDTDGRCKRLDAAGDVFNMAQANLKRSKK